MKIREAIQEMKGRYNGVDYSNLKAFTVMAFFCSGVAIFFLHRNEAGQMLMGALYLFLALAFLAAAIYHWKMFIKILKQPKPQDMLEERKDEPTVTREMPQYPD